MNLTDEDIDRLADAIAVRMMRMKAPVLTAQEAMAFVGKRSSSTFERWCNRHKVKRCDHGRYSRRELEYGMNKEARNRPSRKTK